VLEEHASLPASPALRDRTSLRSRELRRFLSARRGSASRRTGECGTGSSVVQRIQSRNDATEPITLMHDRAQFFSANKPQLPWPRKGHEGSTEAE
jgi:hypothetical protein